MDAGNGQNLVVLGHAAAIEGIAGIGNIYTPPSASSSSSRPHGQKMVRDEEENKVLRHTQMMQELLAPKHTSPREAYITFIADTLRSMSQ